MSVLDVQKRVTLKFEGDFEHQGFRVELEIGNDDDRPYIEQLAYLPPNSALVACLHQWQHQYRSLGVTTRIKPKALFYKGMINPIDDCRQTAHELSDRLLEWMQSESFRPIDQCLREELSREDAIRILIRSRNRQIEQLPWHLWDIVERYPRAEVALGSFTLQSQRGSRSSRNHLDQPKILAILGHQDGIDVESDRRMLTAFNGVDITFLVEPKRQQINDHLWDQPWDILFFAGHSQTDGEQGRIYINPNDSLTLDELKYSLRRAIAQGLQLAIFNSCDGLGLAYELEQLQIPQLIVMRQPIPDQVAHEFLKYLLNAFVSERSLYVAQRMARERLQGMEDEFPCASWLPVIYQHPHAEPLFWERSQADPVPHNLPSVSSSQSSVAPDQRPYWIPTIGLISLVITLLVMGMRWMGWLQHWELQAYDWLLQQRPPELPDARLLLVEATEEDLRTYGYPLPDRILVQAIETLTQHQATTIGLDIYRDQAVGMGYEELANQFQGNPNLITICAFGDEVNEAIAPPPTSPPNRIGFVDLENDADHGTVRRHLLSRYPIQHLSSCDTSYSFALLLALNYLVQHNPSYSSQVTPRQDWRLGETVIQRLTPHRGGYQGLDARGNQILINYRSTPIIAQQVSVGDVLQDRINPDWIRDRIVLIGVTAHSVQDYHETPYGRMRGLTVHAHLVSQILSAVLDDRPLIQGLPQWADMGWVWIWTLASGLTLGYVRIRSSSPLVCWILGSGVVMISGLGLYGSCAVWLTHGLWMPFVPVALTISFTLILVLYIPT